MGEISLTVEFDFGWLSDSLNEYAEMSGKDIGEVVETKGKQLSIELYKSYRTLMPEDGQIWREAAARGWRTISSKTKKGLGYPRNVQELRRREKVRGYLSVGWLYRRWRPRRQGGRVLVEVRNRKGRVIGSVEGNRKGWNPTFILINRVPGVAVQEVRHGVVSKAVRKLDRDMHVYIQRKLDQRAAAFSRKGFRVSRKVFKHVIRRVA